MAKAQYWLRKFVKSIWFFPAFLFIILTILTCLKISGSSIGIYHAYFSGASQNSALIANQPRSIRSDEWIVNTQMTIAQKNGHYQIINKHIGSGQDMSVILDVPYKSWSQIFRPHNLAFFLLPFDNAFAFKWWLMSYLLVVSCYFFVLSLLPGRRFIAAMLGLSLLFGAFTQWWYQYITIGTLYYTFFLATSFVHILCEKKRWRIFAWSAAIAYLTVCFILVLYPPFQIACGAVLALFIMGFALEKLPSHSRDELMTKSIAIGLALLIAGITTLAFIKTHDQVVHRIQNTAYPGKRVINSGNYDAAHLFSGHLGGQFSNDKRAANYSIGKISATNQSESANYVLLLPFLLLPSLYLIYKNFRRKEPTDFALLSVSVTFTLLLVWFFVPHLGILGKLTLLDKVPLNRLIIGLGVLNIFQITLFVRMILKDKMEPFSHLATLVYVALIFVAEVLLGVYAMHAYPEFIGIHKVLVLALPVPLIVYALFRRQITVAAVITCAFAIFTSVGVNPLYAGTAILTRDPLSNAIRNISSKDDGRWISEDVFLENFATMSGANSLTGVYTYPQLDLWRQIDHGKQSNIYNRYAHVNFNFDRHPEIERTSLKAVGSDSFGVITEPCGTFIRDNNVHFLITEVPFESYETCAKVIKTVAYPQKTVYIYRVN